jgi:TMEM175 potassium channel family protein
MEKDRLLAFSDGVIAIIITIMVLELKAPHGAEWADLLKLTPVFLSYVLSFTFVAIYWNNHHHLLYTLSRVNGTILWANLHLLFWLSLIPFATAWVGDNPFAPVPTAVYGIAFLMPGCAYYLLVRAMLRVEGPQSTLARAVGRDLKGKGSLVVYAAGVAIALVEPRVAIALYVAVALIWLVPDRRIEKALAQ